MISAFAAILSLAVAEPVTLVPTDDIWLYEHASDQSRDEYMRIWGAPSGPIGEFLGDFSFSCVKFTLPDGLDADKLVSAKFVVYSIPDVQWTAADSKTYPLQARRLTGDFTEAKWDYSDASTLVSKEGEAEVYGFGSGTPTADKPFPIEIDLLKGKANFKEALKDKTLRFALTSAMNPQDAAGSVYKVFSRNASDEALRPKLILSFSD